MFSLLNDAEPAVRAGLALAKAVAGHDTAVEVEPEEFKRFRESSRRFVTAELPEEKFEPMRSSRMDPRRDHLDKLLDPK